MKPTFYRVPCISIRNVYVYALGLSGSQNPQFFLFTMPKSRGRVAKKLTDVLPSTSVHKSDDDEVELWVFESNSQ